MTPEEPRALGPTELVTKLLDAHECTRDRYFGARGPRRQAELEARRDALQGEVERRLKALQRCDCHLPAYRDRRNG